MAILSRGNDNWNQLAALIERVGTANVLYAIAAINRDKLSDIRDGDAFTATNKLCGVCEDAANKAAQHDPRRTGQVAR